MPLSPSQRLYNWCLKAIYWNSLVLGLLPAPFNWNDGTFEHSKAYFFYSFLIQCLLLILSPLGTRLVTSPDDMKRSYMHGHIILEMAYYCGKLFRLLASVVLCFEIWHKRQQILDLYDRYRLFKITYETLAECCNIKNVIEAEIRRARLNIVSKVLIGHINLVLITMVYIVLQRVPGIWYILMVTINFIQAQLLTIALMVLFVVLTQLHLNFTHINKALEAMLGETSPQRVINTGWRLYAMHFECYQMSLKILSLCRSVTLFALVKIFCTKISMLYHAVLFCIGILVNNWAENVLGSIAILVFYLDTVLLTAGINNLQESCNRTDEILGYFVEKEHHYATEDFLRMFNEFHHYLAGHKLQFSIFGMVNLNRSTIPKYFISALIHLIVVLQFDIKLRPAP